MLGDGEAITWSGEIRQSNSTAATPAATPASSTSSVSQKGDSWVLWDNYAVDAAGQRVYDQPGRPRYKDNATDTFWLENADGTYERQADAGETHAVTCVGPP